MQYLDFRAGQFAEADTEVFIPFLPRPLTRQVVFALPPSIKTPGFSVFIAIPCLIAKSV